MSDTPEVANFPDVAVDASQQIEGSYISPVVIGLGEVASNTRDTQDLNGPEYGGDDWYPDEDPQDTIYLDED